MSYAIVKVGGKQYRVEEGQSILVDRMQADEGDKVDLQPLLFADGDKSVLDSGELGRVKIQAVKFKPKRGYKRRYGARSHLTRLEISSIKAGARKKASDGS
jgi:large subunit ribosomal protein L21